MCMFSCLREIPKRPSSRLEELSGSKGPGLANTTRWACLERKEKAKYKSFLDQHLEVFIYVVICVYIYIYLFVYIYIYTHIFPGMQVKIPPLAIAGFDDKKNKYRGKFEQLRSPRVWFKD